jgi:uncharacterized protein (TIGR02646 family)
MREIRKGKEPASLTEYRCAPGADYADYPNKDGLRESLVKEQRGLCCYCLSRIRPELGSTKIEHWHCQSHHSAEQLDYSNLLGACMGNEGQPREQQHCDTRKGDRDLSRNPANQSHRVEEFIRFLGDGTVLSSDPAFDAEINDVLNLNLPFLKNNRKAVFDEFTGQLRKLGNSTPPPWEKWLRKWNGDSDSGDLQPFCQVVVYYLRKKLSRPQP